MLIKKVIVTWDAAYRVYPSLRILFYGQVGNLFESGSAISSTDTKAETDNFIVTTSRGAGNYPTYYPIYAVSTEVYKDINSACTSGYCFRSDYTSDNTTTIEFKTIKSISKIKVCILTHSNSTSKATLRVIDINDKEESYIIDDGPNPVGTIHEYDLKGMYNINKVGIVETTIDTNIQENQTERSINVDYKIICFTTCYLV